MTLPKPTYSNELITLYHADCLELLPQLAPESVDAIVTDPPYGIDYRSRNTSRSFGKIVGDDSLNSLRAALPLMDRLLKPNSHAYVFAGAQRLGEAIEAVAAYWRVKNIIIWDKGNAGSRGDCQAGYSQNWEAILYASKGRRPLIGPRPRCIFRYDWQAWRDPVHPTSKPVALMQWLIQKSTEPGELVLDPFMGSGVVPAAANALGRRAVGIEIENKYFQASIDRLARIGDG